MTYDLHSDLLSLDSSQPSSYLVSDPRLMNADGVRVLVIACGRVMNKMRWFSAHIVVTSSKQAFPEIQGQVMSLDSLLNGKRRINLSLHHAWSEHQTTFPHVHTLARLVSFKRDVSLIPRNFQTMVGFCGFKRMDCWTLWSIMGICHIRHVWNIPFVVGFVHKATESASVIAWNEISGPFQGLLFVTTLVENRWKKKLIRLPSLPVSQLAVGTRIDSKRKHIAIASDRSNTDTP